ncbi:hypothetical protein V9T40_006687 [Parthenolecanium corni]|uniref:Uncharacterized protein n=1 Tax=Parthenolecanium corni TaxID=536013 RepID=A0AAN9TRC5_9HEMI
MSDNSVSSPYYPPPYGPLRPDFSSYPRYPPMDPMDPMDRFSPEDEYSSCSRHPGIHRHLRPMKIPAAPRPIIFREPSHYPAPIIIEHNAPKPPPTLLSPFTTLINSFVKSIFPQSYYGDY